MFPLFTCEEIHFLIFYSSRWVEKSEDSQGDDKVLYETRGVLYHELTHAYQLEPQGIGGYKPGTEFWVFIEGMADAVRYHNGFFPVDSVLIQFACSVTDGYRIYFRFFTEFCLKTTDRCFDESVVISVFYQVNRTSAETTSHDP